MSTYRGKHRKYVAGSSNYTVYKYGDVVSRNGFFYICDVEETKGYLPEDPQSGFLAIQGTTSSACICYGNTGPTGAQGPAGPQGNTGPTGPSGIVGDYVISFNGFTGTVTFAVDGGSYSS